MAQVTGVEFRVPDIIRNAQQMVDRGQFNERQREEYLRVELHRAMGRTGNNIDERLREMRQMSGDAGRPNVTFELVRDILDNDGENIPSFAENRSRRNKRKPGVRCSLSEDSFEMPDDVRKELEALIDDPLFDDSDDELDTGGDDDDGSSQECQSTRAKADDTESEPRAKDKKSLRKKMKLFFTSFFSCRTSVDVIPPQ